MKLYQEKGGTSASRQPSMGPYLASLAMQDPASLRSVMKTLPWSQALEQMKHLKTKADVMSSLGSWKWQNWLGSSSSTHLRGF